MDFYYLDEQDTLRPDCPYEGCPQVEVTDRLADFIDERGKATSDEWTVDVDFDTETELYDLDPDIRWAVGDVVPED